MLAVFVAFFFDESSSLLVCQFKHAHELPVLVLAVQKCIELGKELVGVVLIEGLDFGSNLVQDRFKWVCLVHRLVKALVVAHTCPAKISALLKVLLLIFVAIILPPKGIEKHAVWAVAAIVVKIAGSARFGITGIKIS